MTTWIMAALIASSVAFTDVSGSWTGTLAPEDKEPKSAHLVLRQEGGTRAVVAAARRVVRRRLSRARLERE